MEHETGSGSSLPKCQKWFHENWQRPCMLPRMQSFIETANILNIINELNKIMLHSWGCHIIVQHLHTILTQPIYYHRFWWKDKFSLMQWNSLIHIDTTTQGLFILWSAQTLTVEEISLTKQEYVYVCMLRALSCHFVYFILGGKTL